MTDMHEGEPVAVTLCEHADRQRTNAYYTRGVSWRLCDQCWHAALNRAKLDLLIARERAERERTRA